MTDAVVEGMERLGIRAETTLELGCGDGALSLELAAMGLRVFGVDIARRAVEWGCEKALEKGVQAGFITAEATMLPLKGNSFDAVIDASCSHCIIGDHRASFFSEAHRVLRPQGLFLLNALCGEPQEELLGSFDRESRCLVRNGIAGRYYCQADSITEEVERAGFTVVSLRTFRNEHDDGEIILHCTE